MEALLGLIILGVIYAIFTWAINAGAEKLNNYERKPKKKFYEEDENKEM